tara:strand:+ start:2641 stop:3480 length:840 start_codon:yes stop_codon:yes gene_type:complete
MPRKAPKEVIEHRITLGDYERTQLVKAVQAYDRDKYLENIPQVLGGIGVVGIAAALGVAAYGLYQWFELPSLKGKIQAAFNEVALDAGDLMANTFGFEAAGFRARMMARVTTFNTEDEVAAYYNPIIDDLETRILNLKKLETSSPVAGKIAQLEQNVKDAKDARNLAYIETGFKTGQGSQAQMYAMSVLTSQIVSAYTMQNPIPEFSYIGGPGETAREEYRDGLTAYIQAEVVSLNEEATSQGQKYRFSYIGPTNLDTTVSSSGRTFIVLNNQIQRYEV